MKEIILFELKMYYGNDCSHNNLNLYNGFIYNIS